MGLEYKYTQGFEDVDRKRGYIKGYMAVFNNEDAHQDIIMPGAATKAIKEWGPKGLNRIKLCWQHDLSDPIGKTLHMGEDHKGVLFEAQLSTEVPHISDKMQLVEDGVIEELSIGYFAVKYDRREGADYGRYLKELKIFEYSLVTVASNELARISEAKGLGSKGILDELERRSAKLMKALKRGEMHDDTYHALDYTLKQYAMHIKSLQEALTTEPPKGTQTEPPKSTQSEEAISAELKSLIEVFKQ